MTAESKGSVSCEGNMVVIRIPVDQALALRVALRPCPCKAPKSNYTRGIRDRLADALGVAVARGKA